MPSYTLKDYADVRIYVPILAYSPDGSQLAHVTNESGQFNLWVMPSGGGERRQLTHFTDNTVRAADWSPDGKTIVFSADANGDDFLNKTELTYALGIMESKAFENYIQNKVGRSNGQP